MAKLRPIIASLTALAVAGCCVAAAASALATTDRIGHAGLGPVKLGMSERQIERAAKRPIRLSVFPGSDCATAFLAGKTSGLFIAGKLRRIYVRTPRFATAEGVRVGSSEQRVLTAYAGKLRRQPQKYVPGEDDLILRKGNRKLIFSLDDGRVSEISTGLLPEIDYVEGCA